MKPSLQAARDAMATLRLVAATTELAGRFGFEAPAGLAATAREPGIAALLQREAVAELLEALVAATAPTEMGLAGGQVGKRGRK